MKAPLRRYTVQRELGGRGSAEQEKSKCKGPEAGSLLCVVKEKRPGKPVQLKPSKHGGSRVRSESLAGARACKILKAIVRQQFFSK